MLHDVKTCYDVQCICFSIGFDMLRLPNYIFGAVNLRQSIHLLPTCDVAILWDNGVQCVGFFHLLPMSGHSWRKIISGCLSGRDVEGGNFEGFLFLISIPFL